MRIPLFALNIQKNVKCILLKRAYDAPALVFDALSSLFPGSISDFRDFNSRKVLKPSYELIDQRPEMFISCFPNPNETKEHNQRPGLSDFGGTCQPPPAKSGTIRLRRFTAQRPVFRPVRRVPVEVECVSPHATTVPGRKTAGLCPQKHGR